ncbi:Protein of unknown function (DUF2823) [Geosmithia morbida]|uniref:Uncharacterized protein n=1 Tax=Geosmithia morbida TaxID=1094350 RepID=A0A9P4YRC0_9HYPO|nr:Protein of unknown function (DUF2823) [Geosmithia morbida]KAF4119609.1 Protein of unknown function (DUF2823) [Geosmithia morbida]
MESVKHSANYVGEKVQQAAHGSSKETNKHIAKDSDAPVRTRAEAGIDATDDKFKEEKHDSKGEAHKNLA